MASAFPIVGVGASAGGLEAFRQLLGGCPAEPGLAFVLVQHLEPTRASLLSEALAQATTMKVAQAGHGERVEPNRVYVIPPGTQLSIERGVLKLVPLDGDGRRPHLPIDHFFRSLAADRGRQAIGVILSGSASDGTAGLSEIRAHGGITFAQEPRTARFGEMPASAVAAGVVDFCLPLPELGAALGRLASHPYLDRDELVPATAAVAGTVAEVMALVRAATGVDFSEHKPDTFRRRLGRRMAIRQAQDPAAYLALLRREPAEVRALFDDLLIQVTSFFRDESSLDDLKATALPEILRLKPPGAPIRAWVVGCATGEEVYSLAISIIEHLDGEPAAHPVLIFGSDLSERAIQTARAAVYPDAAVHGLGEERLKRFFVRTDGGWRVAQSVRDLCVFVRHDVACDPPFSRLDLLSCRNVLIYFGQTLQRRVLATAHYCLNQPGYLLLGRSESATSVPRWFAPTHKGGRVFLRKPGPSTFRFAPRPGALPSASLPTAADGRPAAKGGGSLARRVDDLVLASYGPPGVVVTDQLEVVQFRGRTGPFLEQPAGEPRRQLLELVRPGLVAPLRTAFATARRTSAPVRRPRVAVDGTGGRTCDLVVRALEAVEGGEPGFLVLFEEHRPATGGRRGAAAGRGDRGGGRVARLTPAARRELEGELTTAQEYVAVLLEEHGRSSAALAAANDDLVSGNEELQSLNEELETAKEELQASNEELTTLNDELNGRNQELQAVNADVLNLLDAVEIPILMLDQEGRIRRFTRRAAAVLRLAPADVGRPLTDLALPLEAPDLASWISRAMEGALLVEAEVQDATGRWHRLQVRPHRAGDGRVDGAILSLADIQELKQELLGARWARDYARSIVEAVQVPLVVLDPALRVLSANPAYYRLTGEAPARVEGHFFFELDGGAWSAPTLGQAVASVLEASGPSQPLDLVRDFAGTGQRAVSVTACAVPAPAGAAMILIAIEDVTARRELERHRASLLEHAEASGRAKDRFLASLSHELRTPLTAILLQAELLGRSHLDEPGVRRAAAAIEASAKRQARLVEDLLDVTRIEAGKLGLALEEVEWRDLMKGAVEAARPQAAAKSVELTWALDGEPVACRADPVRLHQVVANLLANAIKFTPQGGRVHVHADTLDGFARLEVGDTGRGIDPAFLPRVFERFTQEAHAGGDGLGLGLAIVHDLVALHGGTVRAESPGPGRGSTFTVLIPRLPDHVGRSSPASPSPDEKGPAP